MNNREVDRLIAKHIFENPYADHEYVHNGQYETRDGTMSYFCITCGEPGGYHRMLAYSTDIAAAWTVVEKLRQTGYSITITGQGGAFYTIYIDKWTVLDTSVIRLDHTRAPMAICLAALRVVGVDVEELLEQK